MPGSHNSRLRITSRILIDSGIGQCQLVPSCSTTSDSVRPSAARIAGRRSRDLTHRAPLGHRYLDDGPVFRIRSPPGWYLEHKIPEQPRSPSSQHCQQVCRPFLPTSLVERQLAPRYQAGILLLASDLVGRCHEIQQYCHIVSAESDPNSLQLLIGDFPDYPCFSRKRDSSRGG